MPKVYNSNYINLFNNYKNYVSGNNSSSASSFSNKIEELKAETKQLETDYKKLQDEISSLSSTKTSEAQLISNDRKSRDFLPKLKKAQEELAKLEASLTPTLPSEDKVEEFRSLVSKTQSEIEKLSVNIEAYSKIIDDPTSESKQITVAKSNRTKLEKKIVSIRSTISSPMKVIADYDKKASQIAQAKLKVENLTEKYNTIIKDEKIAARKVNKQIDENLSSINDKKLKAKNIKAKIIKNNKDVVELQAKLSNSKSASDIGTIEDFKKFLTEIGYQTTHAEEVYKYLSTNKNNPKIDIDDFKLRKQHPKRDWWLKKVGIPALMVGGAVGLATGSIVSSVFTASANKWWFLTMTTNPVTNFLKTALVGAGIGTVATAGALTAKEALTKLYYKNKYGDVNKLLNDPKSTKIDELLNLISNTKDEILDLRTGSNNIFSRLGRAIKRTGKNIVNRNRIHHVESLIEKLVDKFNKIDNDPLNGIDTKIKNMDPIIDQLTKFNDFFTEDIQKSKIFALLNCKDKNNEHKHKETIENLDIYAKLKMFLDEVDNNILTNQSKSAIHKSVKNNLVKQNNVANELLNNNETVLSMVLKRYYELKNNSDKVKTPDSKTIQNYHIASEDGKSTLKVLFKDSNTVEYKISRTDIVSVESVNQGKHLLIKYEDGDCDTILTTPKKVKIDLSKAGELQILENLRTPETLDYLVGLGYSQETINSFIDDLSSTKLTKNGKSKSKPSSFTRSKVYKQNSEYHEILNEVNKIIENPNLINSNTNISM